MAVVGITVDAKRVRRVHFLKSGWRLDARRADSWSGIVSWVLTGPDRPGAGGELFRRRTLLGPGDGADAERD